MSAETKSGPTTGRFPDTDILRTYRLIHRQEAAPERTPTPRPEALNEWPREGVFGSSAPMYYAAGWQPFPVHGKVPSKVARGLTGRTPAMVPWLTMMKEWTVHQAHFNIGVRLVSTIGFDVDAHDGRNGAEVMEALERELGPLPAAWTSTSRGPRQPSRIHFYRTPWDLDVSGAEGKLARLIGMTPDSANVEIIHRYHRYAVVAPSIHPRTGQRYAWYRPDGERSLAPKRDDLALLPARWQEFMRTTAKPAATAPEPVSPDTEGEEEFWTPAPAGFVLTDETAGVRVRECLDRIQAARIGSVNNTLNREGFVLGQLVAAGFFTGADALTHALAATERGGVHSDAWNKRNGLSWTARGVLVSAISAGLEEPKFAQAGE
jgi:hypothetical protein